MKTVSTALCGFGLDLLLGDPAALTSLHCSNNHIQELDLSANTQLTNVTSNRIGEQS